MVTLREKAAYLVKGYFKVSRQDFINRLTQDEAEFDPALVWEVINLMRRITLTRHEEK